jgi:hypothetical protein
MKHVHSVNLTSCSAVPAIRVKPITT